MDQTIKVELTPDQFAAIRACVTGELESATEWDERSGHFDDLAAGNMALQAAWRRWRQTA